MFQWFDIALLIVLAAIFPVLSAVNHRRALRQLAAGIPFVRLKSYWGTIALEWGLVVLLVPLWLTADRGLAELGFSAQAGWRFWLGLAAAAAASAALFWQARRFRETPENWDSLRRQMAGLEYLLPHDDQELTTFSWLSITAGICEEIVYRGHLMWLLTAASGSWVAFFGSSLIFALGHSYQGVRGMARVFAVGLVMAALYLLTGSLWAPILLHVAIDLSMGQMAHTVLSSRQTPAVATA